MPEFLGMMGMVLLGIMNMGGTRQIETVFLEKDFPLIKEMCVELKYQT